MRNHAAILKPPLPPINLGELGRPYHATFGTLKLSSSAPAS